MKKTSFIKGAIIAYIFIVIIKLLGVLYVIPFYNIIGEYGGVLYTYAYSIYNLFLSVATSGIPIALSIIVSEYIALKKYKSKELVFSLSNKIVGCISLIGFVVLFVFAKQIGSFYISGIQGGSNIEDVTLVIRSVSFCLLILPFLSVIRGYLQGHKYIQETSFSELIEQVARIIFVLLGAYLVINVLDKDISIGVSVALFGALFGGVIAYLYLKRKLSKNKLEMTEINDEEVVERKRTIIKKIIKYSIPVIIIAVANDIYQIVDIKLVIKGLYLIGYDVAESEVISSIISMWTPKICMVIIAVSMGITTSLVPHIAEVYVKKNYESLNSKINESIGLCFLIAIPSVVGICLLSSLVYNIFYGVSEYGELILKYVAIVNGFACLHKVLNMVLQAMGKFKIIYLNTIIGIVLNIIFDIPLILLLNKLGYYPFIGALISSSIGYIASIMIVTTYLKKEISFSFKKVIKMLTKMVLPLISMSVVIILANYFIDFNNFRYLIKVFLLIGYTILGASVYFFICYKNKLLFDLLGEETVNKIICKMKFWRKK